MKIIDGIKHKEGRYLIHGSSREELPEFFLQMGYKVGAEIGVYKGRFLEHFCKAGLKMYGIDPWIIYEDYDNPRGQKRLDFQYEHTKRLLAPYDCTLIRKTSVEAAKDFKDESLDFVFIDGNHMFKYVAEDIFDWAKKVRKGGIVSGHDYVYAKSRWSPCHVKYVVEAYVASFRIKDWYLVNGANKNKQVVVDGKIVDKTRSWMWIKT